MRNYIYKDKFYKKADPLPKYFQVVRSTWISFSLFLYTHLHWKTPQGTIIESKADYYSGRLNKKERSQTMVEELLKDSAFKKYTKKKFHVSSNKVHERSIANSIHRRFKKPRPAEEKYPIEIRRTKGHLLGRENNSINIFLNRFSYKYVIIAPTRNSDWSWHRCSDMPAFPQSNDKCSSQWPTL